MKWKDILEQYKAEWILIDVKEIDEDFKIIEGDVIAHSKDKEEIYKKLLELKPKNFSIEYTGEIPEDLAVVLFYEYI
ncbi:MAG: hypothetical protein HY754_11795 [Nitrospirae bacterium]|nr:hypothetical protein [Nitrospirota bacterium]